MGNTQSSGQTTSGNRKTIRSRFSVRTVSAIIAGIFLTTSIIIPLLTQKRSFHTAQKGRCSITGSRNVLIPLNGEWEYYPDRLVTKAEKNPSYAVLPQIWKNRRFGCATYRLTVTDLDPKIEYALKLPYQSTSYVLYLNGRKLADNGRVAALSADGIPEYHPETVSFHVLHGKAEFILQVSNYVHRRGGPFQTILLGTTEQIQKYNYWHILIDGMLAILFLTSGLYQLAFFFIRRNYGNLLLSMFFLNIGTSVLLTIYGTFLAVVLINYTLSGSPFPVNNYLPLSFLKPLFSYRRSNLLLEILDLLSCLTVLCFIVTSSILFTQALPKQVKQKIQKDLSIDNSKLQMHIQEHSFSVREKEVLMLILSGKSNYEIADTLCLSLSTVKTYISRIFKKITVNSRAELFSYFFKLTEKSNVS